MPVFEQEKLPPAVKNIASQIGLFYLAKNNNDYEKTSQELIYLQITGLRIEDDGKVAITTGRPGMLIGARGQNVDALSTYLGRQVKIIEAQWTMFDLMVPAPDYEDDARVLLSDL